MATVRLDIVSVNSEQVHSDKVSVRRVQEALNDRSNTYPDLAIDP